MAVSVRKSNIVRPTEGSKPTGAVARTRNLSGEKRSAGRPPGAKNKPKSMLPTELANEMLAKFDGVIPAEHFEYLKSVVKGGGLVSTEKELDIMILLLGRNLHPALVEEMGGSDEISVDEDTGEVTTVKRVGFRRDVTDRLKVFNSLLTLRHNIDKSKDDGKPTNQPLLTIVADRNLLEGGRLGLLIGGVSGAKVLDANPKSG